MGFYDTLILAARVAQLVFSIIVLGTSAYVASTFTLTDGFGDYYRISVSQVNFIIFVSVWSILIVGYQIAVPRFSEALGHKFVILGLDAITALFWFAGFIALSVFTGAYPYGDNWYHTLQACCAFSAFAWVAFMITTVMSAINVFRGNTGSAKHHHNPEISHSVA